MNANASASAGMAPPRDDRAPGNTSAAPRDKNALAAVLRRGHVDLIRRRSLMLDCTPSDEWLSALMQAAQLLEGPDS